VSKTQHKNLKTVELSTHNLSRAKRLLLGGILAFFALAAIELIGQLAYFFVVGDWLKNRAILPIYQQAETPGEAHELRKNMNYENRSQEFVITLAINAQGFRVARPGEVIPPVKPDNEYRVMLFGPSFAFGDGVNYEDTWGKILGDLLQEHTEKNVRVLNAGVPSLGDYHVLRRAQRLVPEYQHWQTKFIAEFERLARDNGSRLLMARAIHHAGLIEP
jgi:hypothetical protein